MRKIFPLLLMVGFLFLSCDQNKTTKEAGSLSKLKKVTQNDLQDTVLLTTSADVIKISSIPDTISVKMTNLTVDTLTTGLDYEIQKLENNEWVKVLPDQEFQDIGFGLLPSQSKFLTVRMRKDKTVYKSGTYRIVKYYLKKDFQKTREQFFVHAQFRIE